MTTASLQSTLEILRRHAPFDQMAEAHLEQLARCCKLGLYANGEVILGPEDGAADRFYIIKEGRVRGESGAEEGTAWELTAGECFPVGALLGQRAVRLINRAAEETACFELEAADFHWLVDQSPVFHDFCTRRMANLLDNALRDIQARSMNRVSEMGSLNAPCNRLVRRRPLSCAPQTPLREALETMSREHIGSMIVADAGRRPQGMLTLYDVLERVTLAATDLAAPIQQVMDPEVLRLAPEAPAYEAALLMARHSRDHICVVDAEDRLVGVLSERDLFSLQRVGLVSLSRAIARAEQVAELARLGGDIHRLVEQMLAQGASVEQLNKIITELNDGIAQRVIDLTLSGQAAAPAFTWLSFGSEGRIEQTLKTDQDNGILFAVPAGSDPESMRGELLPLAERINQGLAQCGFSLCPGNIMAGNPECCLSLEEWQARFARWIDQGTPEHLLKASIFFDFRPLWGDAAPARQLRAWLTEKMRPNTRFQRQMAANALRSRPPLGLLGDFKVSGGKGERPHTLDLKLQGVTPFVDGARILALAQGADETNTAARLRDLATKQTLRPADAEAWIEAYQYIQLLRMRNHQHQEEQGQSLDNRFDPDELNELDRRILKEAFRQARKLQAKISLQYQL